MNTSIKYNLDKFGITYKEDRMPSKTVYELNGKNGTKYIIKEYNDNEVSMEIKTEVSTFYLNGEQLFINSDVPLNGPSYICFSLYHGKNANGGIESSDICVTDLI